MVEAYWPRTFRRWSRRPISMGLMALCESGTSDLTKVWALPRTDFQPLQHEEGPTAVLSKDQSLTTDGVARHSAVLNETRHSVLLTKGNQNVFNDKGFRDHRRRRRVTRIGRCCKLGRARRGHARRTAHLDACARSHGSDMVPGQGARRGGGMAGS